MNDRRVLRRYLALVHHAEELLETSLEGPASPAPAEAVSALEELVAALTPAVARMREQAPDQGDIRRLLAGWVH